MTDSAPPGEEEALEYFSPWPERLLSLGLVTAAVAVFLPWWGYTSSGVIPLMNYFYSGAPAATNSGMDGWGIVYVLALIASGGLIICRTFGAEALPDLDLPVADWFVYFVAALLMAVGLLAALDSVYVNSPAGLPEEVHRSLHFGWWIGSAATAIIFIGAWLLRAQTVPVGET